MNGPEKGIKTSQVFSKGYLAVSIKQFIMDAKGFSLNMDEEEEYNAYMNLDNLGPINEEELAEAMEQLKNQKYNSEMVTSDMEQEEEDVSLNMKDFIINNVPPSPSYHSSTKEDKPTTTFSFVNNNDVLEATVEDNLNGDQINENKDEDFIEGLKNLQQQQKEQNSPEPIIFVEEGTDLSEFPPEIQIITLPSTVEENEDKMPRTYYFPDSNFKLPLVNCKLPKNENRTSRTLRENMELEIYFDDNPYPSTDRPNHFLIALSRVFRGRIVIILLCRCNSTLLMTAIISSILKCMSNLKCEIAWGEKSHLKKLSADLAAINSDVVGHIIKFFTRPLLLNRDHDTSGGTKMTSYEPDIDEQIKNILFRLVQDYKIKVQEDPYFKRESWYQKQIMDIVGKECDISKCPAVGLNCDYCPKLPDIPHQPSPSQSAVPKGNKRKNTNANNNNNKNNPPKKKKKKSNKSPSSKPKFINIDDKRDHVFRCAIPEEFKLPETNPSWNVLAGNQKRKETQDWNAVLKELMKKYNEDGTEKLPCTQKTRRIKKKKDRQNSTTTTTSSNSITSTTTTTPSNSSITSSSTTTTTKPSSQSFSSSPSSSSSSSSQPQESPTVPQKNYSKTEIEEDISKLRVMHQRAKLVGSYECKPCGLAFKSIASLQQHSRGISGHPRVPLAHGYNFCKLCSLPIRHSGNGITMANHILENHHYDDVVTEFPNPLKTLQNICPHCDKNMYTSSFLRKHIKSVHAFQIPE